MKEKHAQLQDVAIGWLYGVGCSVFAKEVPTANGVADALGVKTRNGKNDVYYIECKASRAELICLKQKCVYLRATGTEGRQLCFFHGFKDHTTGELLNSGAENCDVCQQIESRKGDTGIDFYYLLVADGVKVEPSSTQHSA